MTPSLQTVWEDDGNGNGTLVLVLNGVPADRIAGASLWITSQLFPRSRDAVTGARLALSDGSCHVFDTLEGREIRISDLDFRPRHAGEGPASAWLEGPTGVLLLHVPGMGRVPPLPDEKPETFDSPPKDRPFCIPAPRDATWGDPEQPAIYGVDETDTVLCDILSDLGLPLTSGPLPEIFYDPDLPNEGYEITVAFGTVRIRHGEGGRLPALMTLAQIAWGAEQGWPPLSEGAIVKDAPAYRWRGLHLDCARHFIVPETLRKVFSVMSLLKLNRFHWHLTDDEAWRLDLPEFPELARIGGTRGSGCAIPPQLCDGPDGQNGVYTAADISDLLGQAQTRGVTVMPEIDLPGHCSALIRARPDLIDPAEPSAAYRSVHNFANNAINPAADGVATFIPRLLDSVMKLFPNCDIHLGGDELPKSAWAASPRAVAAAAPDAPFSLQKQFMSGLAERVNAAGRQAGFWDEQGQLQTVPEAGSLLFCWQDEAVASDLVEKGYSVVLCPAQDTYLDMAISPNWNAKGGGWAGHVPLGKVAAFDPAASVAPEHSDRIEGVQACLWSEHIRAPGDLAAQLFPRLPAISEAAWTENGSRSRTHCIAMSLEIGTYLTRQLADA